MEAGNYLASHMHEVPIIAVFCFNPKLMAITDAELDRPSVVGGGSVYPAVQNLLLACRNEGLGCVLTTLLCYEEEECLPFISLGKWRRAGLRSNRCARRGCVPCAWHPTPVPHASPGA